MSQDILIKVSATKDRIIINSNPDRIKKYLDLIAEEEAWPQETRDEITAIFQTESKAIVTSRILRTESSGNKS